MRNSRRSNVLGTVLLCCAIVGVVRSPAAASHFRYGKITWTTAGGNTIEFTIDNSWRRTAYTSGNNRCRDVFTAGLPRKDCTGPGSAAGVGNDIREEQGAPGTTFNPGEGAVISSPLGQLLYHVSAIDPTNDWLIGTALDPTSLPASGPLDTIITKTYSAPGSYTAFISTCCRIEASMGHVNNPEQDYRLETLVNVGTGNRSPVSSMPPIVQC